MIDTECGINLHIACSVYRLTFSICILLLIHENGS